MKSAGAMGLDPQTLWRMTLADFHAYAAGFSARHAPPEPEGPSDKDVLEVMAAERRREVVSDG